MKDMKGIAPNITCHELNVDSTFKPIKQTWSGTRKRRQWRGSKTAQSRIKCWSILIG